MTRHLDDDALIQYYVAERGRLADGALALLAARAALLGHTRWRQRPTYARWHARIMTKVVLGATAEELAAVHAATEALALTEAGDQAAAEANAVLLVLPPRPKAQLVSLLGHLRLAPRGRGPAPEPATRPALVLVAASDLGMHGGKLAAQCAHAVLLAQVAYGRHPSWAAWTTAGRPLALRRLPSVELATLEARYPGSAVHDAGHTQVPAGSLTVVGVPPYAGDADRLLDSGAPW